jgi:signal transduction histidine kinase
MTEYEYDLEIGLPLIERIEQELRLGESVCLLGARDVGKRWVIHRLFDSLTRHQSRVAVTLELDRLAPHDHASLAEAVREQARCAGWSGEAPGDRFPQLLQPLVALAEKLQTRLVVLFANVDTLPHELSVRLLNEIQAGVFAKHFDVVLTGEAHLRELVTEENSPFRCTRYFVLQRFDRAAFREYIESRSAKLGITMDETLGDFLYEHTNGQIHQARHLLWATHESQLRWRRAEAETDLAALIRSDEFACVLETYGLDLFHRAARLVEQDEGGSLSQLSEILAGGSPIAPRGRPSVLELSGLVSRGREHRLSFSSPLARQFATSYFTPRRWGDMLARLGRRDEAIVRYQKTPPGERRLRPLSGEDASQLRGTLEALGAAMQRRELSEHPLNEAVLEALRRDFEADVRYFLGYRYVAFARRAHGGVWKIYGGDVNDGMLVEENRRLGASPAEPHWRENIFVLPLPGLRGDAAEAVLVRDGHGTPLRAEQRRMLEELARFFSSAFAHVTHQIRTHESLLRGQDFRGIAIAIASLMHRQPASARDIVQLAARLLVERFGLRRVMFCLVDSRREYIAGAAVWPRYDHREHEEYDNLRLVLGTTYRLKDRGADVQVDAINEPGRYLVSDLNRPGCVINFPLVDEAHMVNLAVLPLQGQEDSKAIGTLHLERADGTLPSEEELREFEAFNFQLALLLDQCERTNLLLGGLDATQDPIVIVDARGQARYANQAGAELFQLAAVGWQKAEIGIEWPERFDPVRLALAKSVLDDGKEYLAYLERRPNTVADENTFRVHVAPFDFAGGPAAGAPETLSCVPAQRGGAVLHCLVFDHLCAIREAFVAISEAFDETSLWRQIEEAAIRLGHTSGRIYRVEDNFNTLRCRWAFDRENPDAASRHRHNAFPRGVVGALETWRCFWPKDKTPAGEPLVLGHFPDRPAGPQTDPRGIDFYNLQHTEIPKPPGSLWLDIPMLLEGRPFAKITLDCPPILPPERIALLRLLFRLLNALLDAKLPVRTTKDLCDAFDQARRRDLYFAFHDVINMLRPLASVFCSYQLLPAETRGLAETNAIFENQLKEIMGQVEALARRLGGKDLRRSRLDLSELVRDWQRRALKLKDSELIPRMPELVIEGDADALRSVLGELLRNSAAALPENERPRINLHLAVVGSFVELHFRDHGPGIPPAHRSRIFDIRFTHRPGKPGRHQGLGLIDVRDICQRHEGSIDLDDCPYDPTRQNPDCGAGFIVRLPLAPAPPNDLPDPRAPRRA